MPAAWEPTLARWQDAGLIDSEAAARIREFERRGGSSGLRWPAIAALACGGMMLAAGLLLFVSAHWDELAPWSRFTLVTSMVALLHAGGAFAARRTEALAITLHGIGTAALGAAIALTGQVFNLREHWPSGILLWAVGAWIGWALRRDWLQLSFAAILTPAWLGAEWIESYPAGGEDLHFRVMSQGYLLLSIAYFTAATPESQPRPASRALTRLALTWIGGLTLLPFAGSVAVFRDGAAANTNGAPLAYAAAYGLPLAVAFLLRRKLAWMNAVAAVWVLGLSLVARDPDSPLMYLWLGLGAAGLVAWGMHERRGERVNVGMAAFAVTVLEFYFSTVMDKMDRAASLIGLGVLFLAGGWALEKLRRKLVAQMRTLP